MDMAWASIFSILLFAGVFCTCALGETIGYWKFDSSNPLVDSSGNGRSLTGSGTTFKGNYARFTGSQSLNTLAKLEMSKYDRFTVEFFIRKANDGGGPMVVVEQTACMGWREATGSFGVSLDDWGTQGAVFGNLKSPGWHIDRSPDGTILAGFWHHVAIVCDKKAQGNDKLILYVDGVRQPQSKYTDSVETAFRDDILYIGSRNNESINYRGDLDDLRITAAALGPADFLTRPSNDDQVDGFAYDELDCSFIAKYDGSEQRYVMLRPKAIDADKPIDLLFALHGHGSDRWQYIRDNRGECRGTRVAGQRRGMLIVSPDYRAKTSWMGPAAEADMLQLIELLRKEYKIGRIFVSGGSMGGTSALTFAALHPQLVSGVVALNPLADHVSYDQFQDAISESFGGSKEQVPEEYRKRSALYFPERFTMPVSITLGGKDTLVPPDSARKLAKAIGERFGELIYVDDKPERGHETDLPGTLNAFEEMFRRADSTRVTLDGVVVHPSSAVASGIWFYEKGDSQLLLLGHDGLEGWRCVVGKGDWRLDGDPVKSGKLSRALRPWRAPYSKAPIGCSGDLNREIAEALIEWDWRMRDGIETPRESKTFAEVIPTLRERFNKMGLTETIAATGDEAEWLALHRALRKAALEQLPKSPLLFLKNAPPVMSHQLTQMYGYCSRPGGGIFILEQPGIGMKTREITPTELPPGSFMTPELSPDAKNLYFAYAPVKELPETWTYDKTTSQYRFHLYRMPITGGKPVQLTQGDTDNFFPVCLPDGDILFSSTMRGGYHRCGSGPCFVYTLSRMHPAVLYQHLWTARPDGGGVKIFYGNNTWNPCGIWEARAVPGSRKVMATAAPHHGMTAGSLILVDTLKGIDGEEPLTRLTPEVRFPESESRLPYGPTKTRDLAFDRKPTGYWAGGILDPKRQTQATTEELRWPGHCYKSPWPLSEKAWIASYSFDCLQGEPGGNLPNMFGIYICDTFGNRELLYRDPRISSVWALPIESREMPPIIYSSIDSSMAKRNTGTFYMQNVRDSWPKAFPEEHPITALRVFEIFTKTTPHADRPKVGAGLGSMGRHVLGTVPVEADGSAYFEVPSGIPVYFQALDDKGRAVQTMRSLVYLQPGEMESCIGCHENRQKASAPGARTIAQTRPPSVLKPGPEGAYPFSFAKLVQPILDKHCIACHDGSKPKCPKLTGEREGWATKSFNVLIRHVSYSGWGMPKNNFEPTTEPLRFGALASPLLTRLENKHGKVTLSKEEMDRMILWMDSNGACHGTYDLK